MIVQAAYPCRSLNTGQNDVNVEMDPTSAIEVRQEIEEHDMQVVGWYHSHPTFVPDPSLMDIENQKSYQTQWRDEYTLEPFVGAIVGKKPRARTRARSRNYLASAPVSTLRMAGN